MIQSLLPNVTSDSSLQHMSLLGWGFTSHLAIKASAIFLPKCVGFELFGFVYFPHSD